MSRLNVRLTKHGWDALVQKRCGIRRIEAFDPSRFPSQVGGELPSFSLGDYILSSGELAAVVARLPVV